MLLKPGAKVDSLFARIGYVFVKDVTRLGRKITKTTTTLSIDFTFTFTYGSQK